MDIQTLLATALQTAQAARKPTPDATDEQVADAIQKMAKAGYEPSEAVIPIVRDIVSGRGVLVAGRTGAGKTFLFQTLGRRIVTAAEICSWGLARIWEFHEQWDGDTLCIDDLGAEGVVSEWGVKDDLMKTIIAHRAERQKGVTHVTTNLDARQIRDRYGDRTLSRLIGMCRCHRLDGRDRRRDRVGQASGKETR